MFYVTTPGHANNIAKVVSRHRSWPVAVRERGAECARLARMGAGSEVAKVVVITCADRRLEAGDVIDLSQNTIGQWR